MTGSGFTRLGGFGALIGGVLWGASFGAAQAISPDLKGILVGPVLLMLFGLAALQARHATGWGRLGKAGFALTLVGLVLLAYGDQTVQELRNHVAKEIGPIAKPRSIMVVSELPKTRSGKIMRRLLKDVAEHREVGDVTTLADSSVMGLISQGLSSGSSEE